MLDPKEIGIAVDWAIKVAELAQKFIEAGPEMSGKWIERLESAIKGGALVARCAVCKSEFVRRSMTHKACSPECAAAYAKHQRVKKERKELRARKAAIKPRSAWLKEAQAAFNAYIRERDKAQPCICCGQPLTAEAVGGGYDCGHYRSTGSAPHLRFDERNAHGQRKVCNRWGAGRAVDYRIGLVARIGWAAVEALEADNQARKYSIDELKRIKAEYKQKLKCLKGGGTNELRQL